MGFKNSLTAFLVATVITGCAIIQKPARQQVGVDNSDAWRARRARLADLGKWSLQGRVASGKLLGWTGNLNWRQSGEHFNVRLAGPLGAGGLSARGTLARVRVTTGDGRRVTTRHPQALVKKTLGFAFPLRPLRYWARGLPAPGDYQRISVDDNGRLRSLRQAGWHVSFPDYVAVKRGLLLPKRIVLDNGDNRMRLVVDRWFGLARKLEAAS